MDAQVSEPRGDEKYELSELRDQIGGGREKKGEEHEAEGSEKDARGDKVTFPLTFPPIIHITDFVN